MPIFGKERGEKVNLYISEQQNELTASFHVLLLPQTDVGQGKTFWHLVLINLLQLSHGHSTL